MLIKFGSIVTDGRGKLGGQVYSKNRGGNYVRNNTVPTNPRTQFQQSGRAALGQFSAAWSGLTEQQRAAWDAATERYQRTNVFGDKRKLTGKNLFTSLNKELALVGGITWVNPPEPHEIATPISIMASWPLSGDFEITADIEGDPSDIKAVIKCTPVISQGTRYIKNKTRVIEVADAADLLANPGVDLSPGYTARFGQPVLGDKIGIELYFVNPEGRRTPAITHFINVEP